MEVIGVQPDIVWEDKKANYDNVRALLETARVEPNSLVVLPEMFATGFSMNVASIGETESGETAAFLSTLAAKHRSYVLAGVVTRAASGRGRNEAVVFDPAGREIARYGKLHPFSYAQETEHYEPGDAVVTFPWQEFTVAPFICYDLRFPEVFRHAVEEGANLLIVIACWPDRRAAHWLALLTARAIENQSYVVGVNRCGRDPKLAYTGHSRIIDPRGNVLVDAGNDEGTIRAELDFPSLVSYRGEFPVLADVRREYRKQI